MPHDVLRDKDALQAHLNRVADAVLILHDDPLDEHWAVRIIIDASTGILIPRLRVDVERTLSGSISRISTLDASDAIASSADILAFCTGASRRRIRDSGLLLEAARPGAPSQGPRMTTDFVDRSTLSSHRRIEAVGLVIAAGLADAIPGR